MLESLLNRVAGRSIATLLNRDSNTGGEYYEFFYRTPAVAASNRCRNLEFTELVQLFYGYKKLYLEKTFQIFWRFAILFFSFILCEKNTYK